MILSSLAQSNDSRDGGDESHLEFGIEDVHSTFRFRSTFPDMLQQACVAEDMQCNARLPAWPRIGFVPASCMAPCIARVSVAKLHITVRESVLLGCAAGPAPSPSGPLHWSFDK